ncbi:hypothetical protein ABW21_db0204903 [Orbilia brochopaga]|nr:hypothetical protein ABW21_db0204903 [Drechslerella brochopaga]
MQALPAPINNMESTLLRGQVIVFPERDVPKVAYNYGPYKAPNNEPDVIRGIPETSPLADYRSQLWQYRLCWYGYEDDRPNWPHPHICDLSIPGALEGFWEGTIWAPKRATSLGTDHLVTLGEENENGVFERRAIGAKVQDDGTIATTLYGTNMRDRDERLSFEFEDRSRAIAPGTKIISLSRAETEMRFGIFDDWELEYFYACDHPANGRILYLANPYWRTNQTDYWTTIPCQIVRLQLRYWLEDYRFRILNPPNLPPGQLAPEDPENMPGNTYDTIDRTGEDPVPRRITFIDEFGDIEFPWTPEEITARRQAIDRGEEYVRPYIQQIREQEGAAGNYQEASTGGLTDESGDEAQSNPLFRNILNDILGEGSEQSPLSFGQPNRLGVIGEETEPDSAGLSNNNNNVQDPVLLEQNRRMQMLLDRVLGIGNGITLMGMENAARNGGRNLPADIRNSDDLDLLANVMSRGNDINNPRLPLPASEEYQGYAADDSRLTSAENADANQAVPVAGPVSANEQSYCLRVFGRLCETLTNSVGGLFGGMFNTPTAPVQLVEGTDGVELFREPEEEAEDSEPWTFQEPI